MDGTLKIQLKSFLSSSRSFLGYPRSLPKSIYVALSDPVMLSVQIMWDSKSFAEEEYKSNGAMQVQRLEPSNPL